VNDRKRETWEGWAYWAQDLEQMTGEAIPRERWTDLAYMVRRSVEIPVVYGPLKGLPRRKDRILKLLDETTMVADYEVVGDLTIENLATIPHPKLLVYDGRSAWLSSFRVLRDVLANCTPVVLEGGEMRHFAPLETPAALVNHLMRFLGLHETNEAAALA
jgi:hypothetical protein